MLLRVRIARRLRAGSALPLRAPVTQGGGARPVCRTLDLERSATSGGRRRAPARPRARLGPWSVGVVCLEGLGRYERGLARDLGLVKLASALWGRRVEAEETDELLGAVRRVGRARERVPAGGLYRAGLVALAVDAAIAILGAGKIGESLLAGLRSSDWRRHRRHRRAARSARDELRERYGVEATTSNAEAIKGADVVVLAVKPQDIEALLGEIGHLLTAEQTVLSVAAAITTAQIERHLAADVPVVRAMPNAPSTVHEGIAGMCAGAHAEREHLDRAGGAARRRRVVEVPETSMDAITAVSGSGPAYFALLAEAMIEAGILLGLSREVSTSSSCRRCSARRSCCATRRCTRSSCARWSPRRAGRRSARSASSSRPACAPRS